MANPIAEAAESDITEVTQWAPGVAVGRYQLVALIASGGMAEIWLARQSGVQGFEKVVVIKRMIVSLEADPDHVQMFLSEARLAAQLTHPNVVQIFELGEEEGAFYIVMEYLDGESLATVRRAGAKAGRPMPDSLCARLIASAAEGLHYAHTRTGRDGLPLTIIHRDVSPQNLIVTFDGSVKVVDFGIAKIESEATHSGKLKGKLSYMSPEQARGTRVDPRADVFALGVVLFEALTRTRFLPKMDDIEMLNFLISDRPLPRCLERRPDLPQPLVEILDRTLARNPDERYQTARELQVALEEWLASSGSRASSAEIADYMRGLFTVQIRERRSMIEVAMTGELTPSRARKTFARPSITGPISGTAIDPAPPAAGQRRTPILAGLAVVVAITVAVWAVRSVTGSEVVAPPPVALAVAALTVESDPPGAAIAVDGVPRGVAPVVLEGVALGQRRISASLEKHETTARIVTLSRPGERTQVIVSLIPTAAALAPSVPIAPPGPAPTRRARGRLSLSTVPWTTVYLGNTRLGDTPLVKVAVPAGKLVLKLVNPEKGIKSMVEVEVRPNETTVKKLRF